MNISTKHYYLVHYKRIHHNDCRNILLQNEAPKIQNGVGEGHLSESKGVPVLEALNCKQKAKIICSSPPRTDTTTTTAATNNGLNSTSYNSEMYVQLLVLSDFRNLRLCVIRNPVRIPIEKFLSSVQEAIKRSSP